MAWNKKHLSHKSFWRSGIQKQLTWVFLALYEVAIKMLVGDADMWRLIGLEAPLSRRPTHMAVGWKPWFHIWLRAEHLSSQHIWTSACDMSANFTHSVPLRERKKPQCLSWPSLWSPTSPLLLFSILQKHITVPSHSREGELGSTFWRSNNLWKYSKLP